MIRRTRFLALVMAVMALCVSCQVQAPPIWVTRGGIVPELFPSSAYITGYGVAGPSGTEADKRRQAVSMARADLAASLRVKVQGVFTSRVTTTDKAGSRYVDNLVRTESALDLDGLDRNEVYLDSKRGLVHVLAVMDKGKAASLLAARLRTTDAEASDLFVRAMRTRSLELLAQARSRSRRVQEASVILSILGAEVPKAQSPGLGEISEAAAKLGEGATGLDARLAPAIFTLGGSLPEGTRVLIDHIVYGETRYSASFGAYLEQRLADQLTRLDHIRILDKSRARLDGTENPELRPQALIHGSYLEAAGDVSLLLRATSFQGEELAATQVRLPGDEVRRAGWKLLPENVEEARKTLEILDTKVKESALKVRLAVDRGDGGIYRKGDKLTFFLKANMDCHAKVIYQQVDGSRLLVFPNLRHPEDSLKKDDTIQIPPAGSSFELEISPPFGTEFLKVYACTEPFDLPTGETVGNSFRVLTATPSALAGQMRGLTLKKRAPLVAEDSAVVNTVDLK